MRMSAYAAASSEQIHAPTRQKTLSLPFFFNFLHVNEQPAILDEVTCVAAVTGHTVTSVQFKRIARIMDNIAIAIVLNLGSVECNFFRVREYLHAPHSKRGDIHSSVNS